MTLLTVVIEQVQPTDVTGPIIRAQFFMGAAPVAVGHGSTIAAAMRDAGEDLDTKAAQCHWFE